ncbi:hypothetical protein ACFE04_014346 [Oxalis oulophora]
MELKNGVDLLNQLITEPYYLSHLLAFFSYFVVRTSITQVLSLSTNHHILYREFQAVLAFSVLTVIKLVRQETWEGFIGDTVFFAKVFLLAMCLLIDYHLAMWFTIVFSVIYLLTQQPAFTLSGVATKLTPLQLEALLTEGNTSRFWLVEFRALCSSSCILTSRCFPELSITYSTKNLSFGIVDLGLFPNAAAKFGISLSGSMGQLPTYILFENAAEVKRLPELNYDGPRPTITKKLLTQHFELDRLLLEYISGR